MHAVNYAETLHLHEINCSVFNHMGGLRNLALVKQVCSSWKKAIEQQFKELYYSHALLKQAYQALCQLNNKEITTACCLLQIKKVDPYLNFSPLDFKHFDIPLHILSFYHLEIAIAQKDFSLLEEGLTRKDDPAASSVFFQNLAILQATTGQIREAKNTAGLITDPYFKTCALYAIAKKDKESLSRAQERLEEIENSSIKLKLVKKLHKLGAFSDVLIMPRLLQEGNSPAYLKIMELILLKDEPNFQSLKEAFHKELDGSHLSLALYYLANRQAKGDPEGALQIALEIKDLNVKAKALTALLKEAPSPKLVELVETACTALLSPYQRIHRLAKLAKAIQKVAHQLNPLISPDFICRNQ